jgi:two-component system chemotaxis response regulator CheB
MPPALDRGDRPGKPSVLTCPECSGALWETEADGLLRFRCHVGHVYSPDSMDAAHAEAVERALWAALRALEERVALTRRLAQNATARGHGRIARTFEMKMQEAHGHAASIRVVLEGRPTMGEFPETGVENVPVGRDK